MAVEQPLSQIATITMGTSPKGDTYNQNGEGLPLLNGPTEFGTVHPNCTLFTTKSVRVGQTGDLIFCVRGSTTGRMNWADRVYSLGRGVCSIRGKSNLDTRFIKYCLDWKLESLLKMAGGGTFPNLTQDTIRSFEIPFPESRRKIAAILSVYDDLIENNLRRIKILEEMAQNLYGEWFVKFRFPGHQHARFTDSPLGRIPEGWEVVSVEEIVKRVPSGKKYDQKTVNATGTVPVLDQGRSGIIGYHNDEPGVLASEDAPIIVFANHTCYQRFVMFPFSAIQNVLPFVPSSEYPRNIYWLHYATKDLVAFNDYKGHWPEFMAKELILPLSDICQQFGGFVEPLTKLIYKMEKHNEALRHTRDLLLPRLISGEVDVSELDITVPEGAVT